MPFRKLVDTAVQKLLLLFHVCRGRQFVIVSLPLFTNLVWAMCSVPEDKSCWPQPLTTIPFPLAMIGLIRGHGINFWPMRQEWKSTEGG